MIPQQQRWRGQTNSKPHDAGMNLSSREILEHCLDSLAVNGRGTPVHVAVESDGNEGIAAEPYLWQGAPLVSVKAFFHIGCSPKLPLKATVYV
jgi:hypothetical protein